MGYEEYLKNDKKIVVKEREKGEEKNDEEEEEEEDDEEYEYVYEYVDENGQVVEGPIDSDDEVEEEDDDDEEEVEEDDEYDDEETQLRKIKSGEEISTSVFSLGLLKSLCRLKETILEIRQRGIKSGKSASQMVENLCNFEEAFYCQRVMDTVRLSNQKRSEMQEVPKLKVY